MANIGEPIRRFTVVPVEHPVVAPEGPQRALPIPSAPEAPAKPDKAPAELEPV